MQRGPDLFFVGSEHGGHFRLPRTKSTKVSALAFCSTESRIKRHPHLRIQMVRIELVGFNLCEADLPPRAGIDAYDMNNETDHSYFNL